MSRPIPRSCLRKSLFPLLTFVALASSQLAVAQQYRDYRGIDARYFNPGREYQRFGTSSVGPYRTNGNAVAGPHGLVQQLGGPAYYGPPHYGSASATYSDGRMLVGVARTPAGSFHFSNGLMAPALVPSPAFGVAPWMGAYGPGFYGHGFPVGGVVGPVGIPAAWTIDQFTGQPVPLVPAFNGSMPYFGGVNPYFPGSILAQTIVNMNISMQPTVPSTAAFTMTDPRVMELLAPQMPLNRFPDFADPPQVVPVPNGAVVPDQNMIPGGVEIPDAPPVPQPDQGTPLLNEFEAVPLSDKVSNLADRINSLRYQSSGDTAFRKEDYVSAEAAYRSAIEVAPNRRSPYLRMAFVQIARENFPSAVSYLKTALQLSDDATRSWISAEELYGERVAERARTHGSKLWNWLAERPLSSDRLLLSGTFQQLRGYDDAAEELLSMASYEGPEATYVAQLKNIVANDIGQRAISHELDQMMNAAADEPKNNVRPTLKDASRSDEARRVSSSEAARNGGIFLRGASSEIESPVTNSDANEVPLLTIPQLQD